MSTIFVSFGAAGQKQVDMHFGPGRSETITGSGTSAAGSLTARSQEAVTVFCATAVYATIGASPTASPTVGYYVPAGIQKEIMTSKGDKVAVIDA